MIDKLHNYVKENYFFNNGSYGKWKDEVSMIYVGIYVCFTFPDIKYLVGTLKMIDF